MTSTTYSRDATVAAITDFYKFYIRLPYLDSNALVLAPEDGGWPNIDATELRNRGKSDEVIELLRHLSYIEHHDFRGGWTIDSGSDCIQYHKGACYNNNPDLIKSLPGHVIPIADPTDRNGCYLLLDTQTGKITRYNIMANNIESNWDGYERLDDNDKWRAFPTAPVGQFFGRWIKLYEKLVWMVAPPVDDSHGDGGIYFTRADNAVEENELLEADDDDDVEIEDEFTKKVMNNANAAASSSTPDQDKVAKDRDAAFERGTVVGFAQAACMSLTMSITHMSAIQEQMRLRNYERAEALKMYRDYELYSSGSLREILHKLEEIIDKDSDFLVNEHERHEEDMKAMNVKLDEMEKKLEQQALSGH
ncbi:hypothetical protein KCU93_g3853, partial [Aureobasidium melanogenum]